jgi:SAM-dependent methyltransferase
MHCTIDITIHDLISSLEINDYFSMVGYSDAEWFCAIKWELGSKSGFGQIFDEETGAKLIDIMKRRQNDPRFMFAAPVAVFEWTNFVHTGITTKILRLLRENDIQIDWYERDRVSDDLAAAAGLYPFIHQLQRMNTVVIGNHHLRDLDFLGYDKFIAVSSPNCHLDKQCIPHAVREAKKYGKPAVYLVSAGISAALIIDQLHDEIPDSFFIDCGSIWDAFVGIGGQRVWRKLLYRDPKLLEEWKSRNLNGYEPSLRYLLGTPSMVAKPNPEVDQDRVEDTVAHFRSVGVIMFPEQRHIYESIALWIAGRAGETYSVLEAGCGNGLGSALLERQCSGPFVATDKLRDNVDFARQLYSWIEFETWDLNKPTDLKADIVVSVEAFEHVSDPQAAMTNLIKAANKYVWISTPNGHGTEQPPKNPFHVWEYTPEEMYYYAKNVGFKEFKVFDAKTMDTVGFDTEADPLVYFIEL